MIRTLYEDNHLLIVVKPPNIPSQADDSGDPDMVTLLKQDLKERYNKPGNVYLGLVQRLDRPVGGVMVFAKTSKAASRLADAVRTRNLQKQYAAIVHGKPSSERARLIDYLRKDEKTNTVTVVRKQTPGAKEAVLDYTLLEFAGTFSLLQVSLHTGRPHQIRVQLANLGNPIYGDQRYGHAVNRPGQQIALWSHSLSFEHPVTRQRVIYQASLPDEHPWNIFTSIKELSHD